jgi:hypothetical protein
MNLTFLNAGYLFAALAALVPLVIHLISRRKVETVDFSSLRFLREVERKRVRRVRLRQILLLIVRGLVLLCAALALARPTLRGVQAGGAHARTSVAVVLDDSASMSRLQDGRPLLADAAAAARGIAGVLDEGDQAFLVTAGSPPRSVLPGGTFSRAALRTALDGVTPRAAATDYPAALALARDLLSGARNLNREIYVVGDMQRTGWTGGAAVRPAASGDAAGNDGAAPDPGPAGATAGPRVYCIPTPGPEGNLGVSVTEVARAYGSARGLHSVAAEVANHGRRAATVPVRLFVGDRQVGQAGVDVPPGGAAPVRFSVAIDDAAWAAGRVEIPADAFGADDADWFAVPPARPVEVLVVEPDGAGERSDAYYLRRALDPTGDGRFSPVGVAVSALSGQDRGRFPVVALADAGRVSGPALEWVERHVAAGGGALFVLGRRTDARAWNEGPLPALSGVMLRAPFERPAGVRLAPSGQGHPLLDGLVFGGRLVDDASVRRGFVAAPGQAQDVLEAPGIGPVLTLFEARGAPGTAGGEGASAGSVNGAAGPVAVLLTGVDTAWSDLPTSGLIVPLSQRLVERLGAAVSRAASAVIGGDLVVALPAAVGATVTATLPGGSSLALPVEPRGAKAVAVLEAAPETGVYRFGSSAAGATGARGAPGAPAADEALAVVHADPAESALAPSTDEELRALVPGVRVISPGASLVDEILEARRGRELWRAFLYAALALLAVEMVLARPRRVPA